MADEEYEKIGHFKDVASLRQRLAALRVDLPMDERVLSAGEGSPLGAALDVGGFVVGNRWCIHPMEGWDGSPLGEPTEHTLRRWKNFGLSGAKLIWGGEAFAVQNDARANPNQLALIDDNENRAERGLSELLSTLNQAHRSAVGNTDDLLVGLQLTHSGRFCKPHDKKTFESKIAYHHPILDAKFGIDPNADVISDNYIQRTIDHFIRAAKLAQRVGFRFVDVKHCHGYLGHELLSGFTRAGEYGGSFENRTRFAREIIERIKSECPGLMIGVRISVFDWPPFAPDSTGRGAPMQVPVPYVYGFGCNQNNPLEIDLTEPIAFVQMLSGLGVRLINASCGSPYYNPHIQRPAMFPPSDGYQPPEDPMIGVTRQIDVVRQLKAACPNSIFVGTGYTYLQEFLPNVAQAVIRENWTDFVGIGRLALTYWDLPLDTLRGNPIQKRRFCRTFSDCTTAPRNGLISGCYPLDPHYKSSPQHVTLKLVKKGA